MKAPQVVMLVLMTMSFCLQAYKDGQPKGSYSATEGLFNAVLNGSLLWWGGFWE